jgi:N-acetylmuramoyl-L-alanine amidase
MTYFHRFTLIITFLFCFHIATVTVQAKNNQTYEVNTDLLNMRYSPSTSSDIAGKLKKGNKVTIFQEKSGWVQTYYNGKKVWVASEYLSPVDETEVFFPEGLLSGYTIVIDPGHGGKDPGAIGHNGVMEKDLILATSKRIAAQLQEAGANVILTRTDDYFVPLNERVHISNSHEADAFISIHFNAFDANYVGGINTYYHKSGYKLAHIIQHSLSEEVALKNRGVIQHDYRVLRDNEQVAILVELGFITNTTELSTLKTDDYQSKVARAITIGLIEYFWDS